MLTGAVPAAQRQRAQHTLERLHLGNDERVIRQRQEWYRLYQEQKITLEDLAEKAPLLARAVRRQRGQQPT